MKLLIFDISDIILLLREVVKRLVLFGTESLTGAHPLAAEFVMLSVSGWAF